MEEEALQEAMELARAQTKIVFEIFNDKEVAMLIAKGLKNIYDALIIEGFSKDEALQILTSMQKK